MNLTPPTTMNLKPYPPEEPSWKTPKRGLILEYFKGEVKRQVYLRTGVYLNLGVVVKKKPLEPRKDEEEESSR